MAAFVGRFHGTAAFAAVPSNGANKLAIYNVLTSVEGMPIVVINTNYLSALKNVRIGSFMTIRTITV